MTNADMLKRALFGDPSKAMVDIKFMLGRAKDLNSDMIMGEAASAFAQVDSGQAPGDMAFVEGFVQREVAELVV